MESLGLYTCRPTLQSVLCIVICFGWQAVSFSFNIHLFVVLVDLEFQARSVRIIELRTGSHVRGGCSILHKNVAKQVSPGAAGPINAG